MSEQCKSLNITIVIGHWLSTPSRAEGLGIIDADKIPCDIC